jgi:phage tail-like protein
MAVAGAPRLFEDKFRFTVEIDGVVHMGFNKCSALEAEIEEVKYREGGDIRPTTKDAGLVDFSDLTIERAAVASDSDLYDWVQTVTNLVSDLGLEAAGPDGSYKRTMDIVCRNNRKAVIKRWRIYEAWPKKFKAGEWDNGTSEKTMESVELSINGFERIPANGTGRPSGR